MIAISVRNLRKSFGDIDAVRDISVDVPEGSFFAFLGPNGAGKSTTISIICSLLGRDSGDVSIFGRDASDPDSRRDIGVVFQDQMLDSRLTVRENLSLKGAMYGLRGDALRSAVDDAVVKADASEFADRMYGQLSGGQRRRADIARALVHCPRIIILDEPTAGPDPQTRRNIWDTITTLNRESNLTVFLTTHYMEEAADADDIVVINHGEIVAHGTPTELREAYCSDTMTVHPKEISEVESKLRSEGVSFSVRKGIVSIPLTSTLESARVISMLDGMMESFEVKAGTLDDAFINITGEEIL